MTRALLALIVLAVLPATWLAAAECRDTTWQEQSFTVCEVAAHEDLRLFHTDDEGRLLASFGAIERVLEPEQTLSFAMNAGMYHPDRSPVGLYIHKGTEISRIATGGGYGNFGMVPNGVFCISDTLNVIESDAFRATAPDCDYAIQSGPMLVVNGDLHPKILPDGTSRFLRNGVGTSADGQRAFFAISNQPVNFHSFATLFRDHLNLPNALFFDGKVSRLYAPDLNRSDAGFALGVMVATVVSR